MSGTRGWGDAPGLGNGALAPGLGAQVRGAELERSRGSQWGAWAGVPGCDLCRTPAAWPPEKGLFFSGSPAIL